MAGEEWEDALAAFTHASTLDPSAALHPARGAVLFRLGRYEESLAALDEALALDADSPGALAHRAAALEAAGRLADASLAALETLAVDPDNATAHVVRGLVALQLGDAHRAEESFRRALESGNGTTVTLALTGICAWVQGDEAAARHWFGLAVADSTTASGGASYAVAEARALALVGLFRRAEATEVLQKGIEVRAGGERSRAALFDVYASGPLGGPPGLAELRTIALG